MPTEQFGTSQIKEIRFTKEEVNRLLTENIIQRTSTPYDFDYHRPIIQNLSDGSIIMRYVQEKITEKERLDTLVLKPIQKSIP